VGNLLHNAVKFSRESAVVTLSSHAKDELVVIRVDDECHGLGGTPLAELCEPYVTQPPNGERGIGLGLAITKSSVESMHGELTVIDRHESGCTFVVSFPLLSST
jgi:signal transduction histidine kinase